MGLCENCGNQYEKTFKVVLGNVEHVFDSFECAINQLAPLCAHFGTKVLGHGVEVNDNIYCCRHCSRMENLDNPKDLSS